MTSMTHIFAPTGATGYEGRGRPVSTSAPETVLRIEVGDADSIPQHRFLLTASVDLQGAVSGYAYMEYQRDLMTCAQRDCAWPSAG